MARVGQRLRQLEAALPAPNLALVAAEQRMDALATEFNQKDTQDAIIALLLAAYGEPMPERCKLAMARWGELGGVAAMRALWAATGYEPHEENVSRLLRVQADKVEELIGQARLDVRGLPHPEPWDADIQRTLTHSV